nr:lipoprotein [Candidatus Enterousia merdequi]
MKKILFLLPGLLILAGCNNTKTYVVGEDAICSGLEETDVNPVVCADQDGNLINGLVKQYYENGNVWREMNIKDGRENGTEREYYENGKIHVIANVVNGKTEGISKLYNEDGVLHMEMDWQNGEVKSIKIYDENGKIIQEKQM